MVGGSPFPLVGCVPVDAGIGASLPIRDGPTPLGLDAFHDAMCVWPCCLLAMAAGQRSRVTELRCGQCGCDVCRLVLLVAA